MAEQRTPRTGAELVASAFVSIVLVSGCVYVALTPPDAWSWQSPWVLGLLLMPFVELARLVPLALMRGALEEAQDAREATRLFLRKTGIVLLVILLSVPGIFFALGLATCIAIALIVFDDVNKLRGMRGDASVEIARLQALSDDLLAWYRLSLAMMPLTIVAFAAALSWLASKGVTPPALSPSPVFLADHPGYEVPDIIPHLDILRCAVLLNVAFYFAGKGIIFAYLDSARFAANGKSLLWRLHTKGDLAKRANV